jgi:hypothetical protein
MKMIEVIRKWFYAGAVVCLCFGPGAFAQVKVTSPTASLASAAVFTLGPGADDWGWGEHKKKHVAAAEGGSAALYLLLAGIACCGAMFVRSRQAHPAKSA